MKKVYIVGVIFSFVCIMTAEIDLVISNVTISALTHPVKPENSSLGAGNQVVTLLSLFIMPLSHTGLSYYHHHQHHLYHHHYSHYYSHQHHNGKTICYAQTVIIPWDVYCTHSKTIYSLSFSDPQQQDNEELLAVTIPFRLISHENKTLDGRFDCFVLWLPCSFWSVRQTRVFSLRIPKQKTQLIQYKYTNTIVEAHTSIFNYLQMSKMYLDTSDDNMLFMCE